MHIQMMIFSISTIYPRVQSLGQSQRFTMHPLHDEPVNCVGEAFAVHFSSEFTLPLICWIHHECIHRRRIGVGSVHYTLCSLLRFIAVWHRHWLWTWCVCAFCGFLFDPIINIVFKCLQRCIQDIKATNNFLSFGMLCHLFISGQVSSWLLLCSRFDFNDFLSVSPISSSFRLASVVFVHTMPMWWWPEAV